MGDFDCRAGCLRLGFRVLGSTRYTHPHSYRATASFILLNDRAQHRSPGCAVRHGLAAGYRGLNGVSVTRKQGRGLGSL